MIVRDQLDSGLCHSRSAHAEKLRPGPLAQRDASRAAYMSLDASPAEIRIVGVLMGGAALTGREGGKTGMPADQSSAGKGCEYPPGLPPATGTRTPALCTGAGTAGNKSRAGREAPDASPCSRRRPFVKHENAMRVLDRAQPVRDHHGRAAVEQPVERLADHQLRLRVHARGGFVEDQKLRIVRQRAREAYQLPLPDRKRRAALGDRGLDSLRQRCRQTARGLLPAAPARSPRGRSFRCPAAHWIRASR